MASINDEYEKLMMIGQGSFATIWKVRHRKYGYIRTLKILNTPVRDENDRAYQQFLKECTVLLNIGNGSNNNIVRIYQPRLIDNRAVVEMDYIDGETLNDYLQRVRFMPADEVLRFVGEIGGALAYCHHDIYKFMMNPNEDDLTTDPDDGHRYIIDDETKRRLVDKYAVTHNDLHSNNVMRRENDGSYVLLDFGLAIQNGKAVKSSAMHGGALEYMAPEKFNDNSVITTQSDIYSFGVLMYEALAGRVPFVLDKQRLSTNPVSAQYDIMQMHQSVIPPSIEALRREAFGNAHPGQTYTKDYPDWLETMILRCLEKDPARRYADAKELMEEFKTKSATAHMAATTETIAGDAIMPELERKNSTLKKRLDATNAKLADANYTIDEQKEKLHNLQSQVGKLNADVSDLRKENEKLMELKHQNQSLTSEIEELKKQSSATKWPVAATILLAVVAAVFGWLWWQNRGNTPAALTVEDMETPDGLWTGQITPDSIMDGYGQMRYRNNDPDGRSLYEGNMTFGKRNGQGLLLYTNKNSFEGLFQDDSLVRGVFKVPGQKMFFEGEFKNNNPYEGSWKDDNTIIYKVSNGKTK